METIELSDLTLTEIPPDVVLFNEVLCEKINSKFKKVWQRVLKGIHLRCIYNTFEVYISCGNM